MRSLILVIGVLLAVVQTAFAQVTFPVPKASIVTILSDGISEPDGAASKILSEISITLDKESDLRVLSLNGYGGAMNIRDLLQLRGADFAVVNSDVLAYLDLSKTLPEARRKVRLVAPLFHQTVLLFARQNIKSIGDLKGRKVGTIASRPSRGVTARTIFGSLKIDVDYVELDDGNDLAKKAAELDAILIFDKDLPNLRAFGVTPGAYQLLSIPPAGPLAKIYLPKKLGKEALAGFTSGEGMETIQVSTLLAAFDWTAKQGRYADAVSFVNNFFTLLPKIRAKYPNSPLARTSVRMVPPGWQRFGPADALAAAAAPAVSGQDDALRTPLSTGEPPLAKESLKLLAVAHPPFTNAQQSDGGVALKLFTGALEAAGVDVSVQWVDGEKAVLDGLVTSDPADVGLFWQTLNCETPHPQSASEAAVCDTAMLSEPVMQAVVGVFTRIDTPLAAEGNQEAQGRTVCAPESQPVSKEALDAVPWLKGAKVKTIRPKTFIDCLAAIDRHDADALISLEAEGRFVIEKLKLSQSLQLSQRIAPTGLHALVAKDNPRQAHLLLIIDDAIAKFKASDRYAAVMTSHLSDLTGSADKVP